MIVDNHGNEIGESGALHRLVIAHDMRYPDHNTPGDRVCRLVGAIGELAEAILALWVGPPASPHAVDRAAVLTKGCYDVLRAAGGIANHYEVAVRLPDGEGDPVNPFVLLARVIAAAGALARLVDQVVRARRRADTVTSELLGAVDRVISRTVVIAEHYGLRPDLRETVQTNYRREQSEGFLP